MKCYLNTAKVALAAKLNVNGPELILNLVLNLANLMQELM